MGGGRIGSKVVAAIVAILVVASFAQAMFLHAVSAQPSTDWPMFRFNQERTGTTENVTPPLELAWSYMTYNFLESSPAVSGDFVYIGVGVSGGTTKWGVYAFDATNGTLRWNFTTENQCESSPAVSGGIVYVGSDDMNLYALNASTGSKVWNYTTLGFVRSSPVVASGRVYVESDDSNVYCLDASSGALVWNYTTKNGGDSSPAVIGG